MRILKINEGSGLEDELVFLKMKEIMTERQEKKLEDADSLVNMIICSC